MKRAPDQALPEGISQIPAVHPTWSEGNQLLASTLGNLNAHGLEETGRDVLARVAKESKWTSCSEGGSRISGVKMSVEQSLRRQVIGEPLVGKKDDLLVVCALAPCGLLNQGTLDDQATVEGSLEIATWEKGVHDLPSPGQRQPTFPGVEDCLRNGLQGLPYEWDLSMEAEIRRESVVDGTEVQVEDRREAMESPG